MDATKHNKEGLIIESYWENGIFYPCQIPVEMPLGYEHPESLEEMVARMVQSAIDHGSEVETAEEADDFGEEDEFPLDTRYTYTEMQEDTLKKEVKKREKDVRDAEHEVATAQSLASKEPQGETESSSKLGKQVHKDNKKGRREADSQ